MNHYETVFILNPVLSETQIEEAVQKFIEFIKSHKGTITSQENWGLKNLLILLRIRKVASIIFLNLQHQAKP